MGRKQDKPVLMRTWLLSPFNGVCLEGVNETFSPFTGPDITLFLPALCRTDINSSGGAEILLDK